MKKRLNIQGMHCASCANIITKRVKKIPGVTNIDVNISTDTATLEFDSNTVTLDTINTTVRELGYSFSEEDGDSSADDKKQTSLESREKIFFSIPVTILIFILMMWDISSRLFSWIPNLPLPMETFNSIGMILGAIMLFWVGNPFIQGIIRFAQYRVANMDTLVGMGTLTAFIYSMIITLSPELRNYLRIPEYTYFDVTIVVIGFITLGKYLETRSKNKTGDAIKKLLNLQTKTALVLRGDTEQEIPLQSVLHDDIVIIKPGSKIPVDGIVIHGESFVDESMITGESIPVQKKEGDLVTSGTINTTGSFQFRATKIGSETMLARIIQMVEQAQNSKAPIQALADKISAIFVPVVLILSIVTLAAWLTLGSYFLGFSTALSLGIICFVGILVIACPCALGLATPTAIIVGVGKGAQAGILIKDASSLQKLHSVNTVIIDKTGTLTHGKPKVTNVYTFSKKHTEEVLHIAGSLEKYSEHPISKAIVDNALEKNIHLSSVEGFRSIQGKGIQGNIGKKEYFIGSTKLMQDIGASYDAEMIERETSKGKTPILIAEQKNVIGLILVSDTPKTNADRAIKEIKKLGIDIIMMTGDAKNTAKHIANILDIDEYFAEVSPEDKLKKIQELQSKGKIVAMVGDGVNDSPALAQADVGIAMATGTDVAIESAGITLLHGDISKIVNTLHLSRITMRGIQQNLFWAFIYNIVGIPLAAGLLYPFFGWLLNPIFAGVAMAFSSVSVVLNSLRIKTKKI